MLTCQKNKLWIENISNLFCDTSLIPLEGMSLAEQMNALTRLVIIVFLILFLLGYEQSILFLLLSLLFIIILFYIQSKNMENFTMTKPSTNTTCTQGQPTSQRFCNDTFQLDNSSTGAYNNPRYMSNNQRLVGGPNPKTLIQPIIAPRLADLSYWKANNTVTYPMINQETNTDFHLSGYTVSKNTKETCVDQFGNICESQPVENFTIPTTNLGDVNLGGSAPIIPNVSTLNLTPSEELARQRKIAAARQQELERQQRERKLTDIVSRPPPTTTTRTPPTKVPPPPTKVPPPPTTTTTEEAPPPARRDPPYMIPNRPYMIPEDTQDVNVACGYDKEAVSNNLPTNYLATTGMLDPNMAKYNKNLFTNTLQPGLYTTSQVNRPINSNIGISFTQPEQPTTRKVDPKTGQITFVQHDPNIFEPEVVKEQPEDIATYNVFDPRYSGYGTSYRSYVDPTTGQPRFYYDDVDAIRRPNYITRNAIDCQEFGDKYGPIPEGQQFGNPNTSDVKGRANQAFLDNSLTFRSELQQTMMQKAMDRQWQKRMAPISTSSQRMMGGSLR